MSESSIISISKSVIGEVSAETVNARELHEFLEVGRDFSNWIKDRIEKYGFEEGIDYVLTLAKTGERNNVVKHEYHLTLDMAKELSMVENNDKGRAARKYFIRVEKEARYAVALAEAELKDKYIEQLEINMKLMSEILLPKRPRRKFTADEKAAIAKFIRDGGSFTEAAKHFGRSTASCWFIYQRSIGNKVTYEPGK